MGLATPPDPSAVARRVVDTASERQASDILLLDVREVTTIADYLVILTAGSARQLGSLGEELAMELKHQGVPLHHREGTVDSGWVLLDYADVIVHLFSEEQREHYQLEQVWQHAKHVVRIQ